MSYKETPSFRFSRNGSTIFASFNNHPLKDKEGNKQELHFNMSCNSELEAKLLVDYLSNMNWEMQKYYFTEGFNTHKRREKNFYL